LGFNFAAGLSYYLTPKACLSTEFVFRPLNFTSADDPFSAENSYGSAYEFSNGIKGQGIDLVLALTYSF